MQSTANLPVIGMDIAKNVFQLHVVDADTGEIQRHKLKRDRVSDFLANRQKSLVALEACGGAHHWARMLQAQGRQSCRAAQKRAHVWPGIKLSPCQPDTTRFRKYWKTVLLDAG